MVSRFRQLTGLLLALIVLAPVPQAARGQAGERCFAETGLCIAGPIQAYWERNGGLPIFGFPISLQQVETVEGRTLTVQWFERDRLEDHGPAGVLAGRLGARYLELTNRPWEHFRRVEPPAQAGCVFFAQTGHSLCEPYLSYWRANGGLERFGYPITRPFYDTVEGERYETQFFERRRMERHPELPGAPLLLGLLGREVHTRPEPLARYPECLSQVPASLLPAIGRLDIGSPVGCPRVAGWLGLPAATQQFERGQMLWLAERRFSRPYNYPPTIVTLVEPGPRPDTFSDTWVEGEDPDMPDAAPPRPDLYAPWRGFGKLWAQQPELREALGWAIEPQAQPRTVDAVFFEYTLLVRVNETGVVYAFGNANNSPYAQVVRP
ncbi:MAG TPA: hypothetical protein VFS21_31585 [Roseiflexaceae bacterium]|nr:hypothetical protein [Roseiflexaceae bacterium]